MKRHRKTGWVLAFVLGARVATGSPPQVAPSAAPFQATPAPQVQATPTAELLVPAPEMRRLQWMIGSWQVLENHEATDWGPAGVGRGTQTVAVGPGAFSVLTEHKSSGPQGQIAGHGVLAWEPEKRSYGFYLVDSLTPGVTELACVWKKNDLVCDGQGLFLGLLILVRWTITEITPGGYTAWFDASGDGKNYRRAVTFRYTRLP